MKKGKISVLFVILVLMFIVFAIGVYAGKKLTNSSSKEGIINESAINNSLNSKSKSNLLLSNGKKQPVSSNLLNFQPLVNTNNKNKKNIIKKTKQNAVSPKKSKSVKPIVKTRIIYVKKPVYVYKYIKIKPKTSVAPKSAASPFSSNVYYTIQVAALSNYKIAKKLADKLNAMGFFAYILPIHISGKNGKAVYQQVRVGKFSNKNDALSVEKLISSKFKIKPYIIKID